jgi:hypothetical protein
MIKTNQDLRYYTNGVLKWEILKIKYLIIGKVWS